MKPLSANCACWIRTSCCSGCGKRGDCTFPMQRSSPAAHLDCANHLYTMFRTNAPSRDNAGSTEAVLVSFPPSWGGVGREAPCARTRSACFRALAASHAPGSTGSSSCTLGFPPRFMVMRQHTTPSKINSWRLCSHVRFSDRSETCQEFSSRSCAGKPGSAQLLSVTVLGQTSWAKYFLFFIVSSAISCGHASWPMENLLHA